MCSGLLPFSQSLLLVSQKYVLLTHSFSLQCVPAIDGPKNKRTSTTFPVNHTEAKRGMKSLLRPFELQVGYKRIAKSVFITFAHV